MSHAQRRRLLLVGGLGAGTTLAALLIAMLAHAGALRTASTSLTAERERAAVVRLVGAPDLAISSSSRWLRHPSLSEPAAPFADAPASLDTDPAGAVLAAPRALYRGTERGGLEVRPEGARAR
jgi:hypothetical protein